jgi:hypothetical protein
MARIRPSGQWGGRREGAGRKRTEKGPCAPPRAQPTPLAQPMSQEFVDLARRFAPIAINALADVAANSRSPRARIAAAERLLLWSSQWPDDFQGSTE